MVRPFTNMSAAAMTYYFFIDGEEIARERCKFPEALRIAQYYCEQEKKQVDIHRGRTRLLGRYVWENGRAKRVTNTYQTSAGE